MQRIYRVGTRRSALALKQAGEAIAMLKRLRPDFQYEIIGIDTYGDKDKTTPISAMEGTDFFTRELDRAILRNEIDLAIHSAKDLADIIPDGLHVAAMTGSADPHDALVSKDNLKLSELPHGARIGTSSARRKEQLKRYRPDFEIVDIRGTIEERLALLDNYELRVTSYGLRNMDAIVIAACGLVRLGLEERITERIPLDILQPHPLQGSLAVMVRQDDPELSEIVSKIDTREKAIVI
jgi:hydroxymethylbilane synthase